MMKFIIILIAAVAFASASLIETADAQNRGSNRGPASHSRPMQPPPGTSGYYHKKTTTGYVRRSVPGPVAQRPMMAPPRYYRGGRPQGGNPWENVAAQVAGQVVIGIANEVFTGRRSGRSRPRGRVQMCRNDRTGEELPCRIVAEQGGYINGR